MSTRNVFLISFMALYLLLSTVSCGNNVVSISNATYEAGQFGAICGEILNCRIVCQRGGDSSYNYQYENVKAKLKNSWNISVWYEKRFVVCGSESYGEIPYPSSCLSGAGDREHYYEWTYEAGDEGELSKCYDAKLRNIRG